MQYFQNASSATGPISLDSNRYNYFDNLAAIGQEDDVIHDDGVHEDAYINGRPPQCVCGALPTYMFSSPTVPHAAMLANRHMSFSGANNERQEEHSASLSPYTSPLNHAIRFVAFRSILHVAIFKNLTLGVLLPNLEFSKFEVFKTLISSSCKSFTLKTGISLLEL